ncbi:VOC family protein [Chryseobacterium sp. CH21]|uniref:VOC family protein n=1 Tax=Chryseobacterium sp. CH21 TaxID=713556 RepID=UPI001E4B3E20|nr:VOC family protein [Chryseobacterium sp. CH21]
MKPQSYILIFLWLIGVSCSQSQQPNPFKNMKATNPVVYFEIPVNDLERAEKFYSAVFNFSFDKEIIDNYEMALFPFEEKNSGITGALAKGEVYKPSKNGVIIYFKTENIDQTLKKAVQHGGSILYQKKTDEKYGFAVAEFEDSEGNRIALHETVK